MTTLEKVARAIVGHITAQGCMPSENMPEAFVIARTAIEALKPTTPDMRIAGGIAIAQSIPTAETLVDPADACWNAMLDRILAERDDG